MQTLAVEQLVGQRLGSCAVEQLLGQGRLSAAYLGQQVVSGQARTVAITTFILPEQFSSQARQRFSARFAKEAASLVTLDHPYILPVYEYGEQHGYPYLVTPYMSYGSLADVLKAKGVCSPTYVYRVLKQIAEALDYAHTKGSLHQALKPANMLLHPDQKIQVAGFGLINLLQMRGIEYSDYTYAHLLSIAGTYLGSPEYIAPEFVQGQYVDGRADIYALGVMLFELLTGQPPFSGTDPIQVALQHVRQSAPSMLSLRPDLPPGLNDVIQRAMSKHPSQRYQTAKDLADAYTTTLAAWQQQQNLTQGVQKSQQNGYYVTGPIAGRTAPAQSQMTPDEILMASSSARWQLMPPITTGRGPVVQPAAFQPPAPMQPAATGRVVSQLPNAGSAQPLVRVSSQPLQPKPVAPPPPPPAAKPAKAKAQNVGQSVTDLDSFAWWSGTPQVQEEVQLAQVKSASEGQAERAPKQREAASVFGDAWGMDMVQEPPMRSRSRRSKKMSRRRAVTMIASGVAAVAVVGVGVKLMGQGGANGTQQALKANNGLGQQGGTQQGGGNANIIANNLAMNSAKVFTNPTDGQGAAAIHLPNGRFVAYETACTHAGVTVAYDANTHMLVCPAHGAIFDPMKDAAVVQGPATKPLTPVAIKVNANGSVTL